MALSVTEKQSAWRLSKQPPWTAHREWEVTGTTSEDAALAAIDPVTPTIKVAQLNDGHPSNTSRLKCLGPKVQERKAAAGYWVIAADYAIPATGDFTTTPDDPLLQPVRVRWEEMEACEQADLDLDKRPIVYTNGEPLSSPVSRPIAFKRLTLVKNFPYWNPAWNASYENATNSDVIILTGGPSVTVQHMRCASIIPAAEFTAGASYVPIALTLEIIFDDSLGDYPFQHRLMDQGTYGFSSDSKGLFVGADGEPVGAPVKLDGTGKPLNVDGNSLIKVKKADRTLAAPASNTSTVTPYKFESTTTAYILYYKKTKVVALNPLLALFNA